MSVHMIDFSEMIIPTLKILYDSKKMMTIKDINKELIKVLDINENMVSEKHTNTNQSEFAYRAAWARTYLKKYMVLYRILNALNGWLMKSMEEKN